MKKHANYRIADFENAIRNIDCPVQILGVTYQPDSFFVQEVIGIIEIMEDDKVMITWDYAGRAMCDGKKEPSFNLKMNEQ